MNTHLPDSFAQIPGGLINNNILASVTEDAAVAASLLCSKSLTLPKLAVVTSSITYTLHLSHCLYPQRALAEPGPARRSRN